MYSTQQVQEFKDNYSKVATLVFAARQIFNDKFQIARFHAVLPRVFCIKHAPLLPSAFLFLYVEPVVRSRFSSPPREIRSTSTLRAVNIYIKELADGL